MVDVIFRTLRDRLEQAKKEDHLFSHDCYVPIADLESILSHDAVSRLFEARVAAMPLRCSAENLATAVETVLGSCADMKSRTDGYIRVLGALIYSFNESGLDLLVGHLLGISKKKTGLPSDGSLPIEQQSAQEIFGDQAGYYFSKDQHLFCAQALKAGLHQANCIIKPSPVPFVGRGDFLGHGSAGTVYKIKVARHCWKDEGMSNDEESELAVKIYAMENRSEDEIKEKFEQEVATVKKLLRKFGTSNHHINLPIGILHYEAQRCLLYRVAAMDLFQYFYPEDSQSFQPRDDDFARKLTILKNATELVGALDWLYRQAPDYAVYHLDIRPV